MHVHTPGIRWREAFGGGAGHTYLLIYLLIQSCEVIYIEILCYNFYWKLYQNPHYFLKTTTYRNHRDQTDGKIQRTESNEVFHRPYSFSFRNRKTRKFTDAKDHGGRRRLTCFRPWEGTRGGGGGRWMKEGRGREWSEARQWSPWNMAEEFGAIA